jgi:restriction endonuclease S subunit
LQQHLRKSVVFPAQPGIYLDFVANIPVPPTVTEQVSINEILQQELSPIDTTISRFEREIEFFREYRARLVADESLEEIEIKKFEP